MDHFVEDLLCLGGTIRVKFDAVASRLRAVGNRSQRRALAGARIQNTGRTGKLEKPSDSHSFPLRQRVVGKLELRGVPCQVFALPVISAAARSEERRVGKECRS